MISRMRPGPIGIDFDSAAIRAVQLAGSGRPLASLELPRSRPGASIVDEDLDRVRDVLERHGFEGSTVVLPAPTTALRSRVLELPPRGSDAPLAQLAAMEMGRELRLAPGSFECASWDIPPPARGADVSYLFAAACSHETITPILDALESAGFDPAAVECRSAALARVLASAKGVHAFAEVGRDDALLGLAVNGVVVYERAMPEVSLAAMEAQAAEHLRISPELAGYVLRSLGEDLDARSSTIARAVIASHAAKLVDDLQAAVSYALHRYPDAGAPTLTLCGPGACFEGLLEQLTAETGIAVSAARSFAGEPMEPSLMAACGLARRAVA